jgi:hypothetical protein
MSKRRRKMERISNAKTTRPMGTNKHESNIYSSKKLRSICPVTTASPAQVEGHGSGERNR